LLHPSLATRCAAQKIIFSVRRRYKSTDPTSLIRMVLAGTQSVATDQAPTAPSMPSFGQALNDREAAAVLSRALTSSSVPAKRHRPCPLLDRRGQQGFDRSRARRARFRGQAGAAGPSVWLF
jgi:hypothetical protein